MTDFRYSFSSLLRRWRSFPTALWCLLVFLLLIQGCAPEVTPLSWEHTRGPAAQNVSALIISATDANQLTAGLTTGELFRSTDAGETWASLSVIKPIAAIHRLIQHPEDLSRLYAATGSGLKESLDGGRTWENIPLPVAGGLPDVQTMALDPYSPSILFAGVHTAGLLRSNNDGRSWTPVRQLALAASDSIVDVRDIAIDPVNPSAMYVAVMGKGIFKTTNRGDSWTYVTKKLGIHGVQANALCVAPTGRTVLYGTSNGNIFRSTDEGEQWTPVRQGYLDGQITSISGVPGEKIFYAGTDLGILASTDGGEHWDEITNDLPVFSTTLGAIQNGSPHGIYVFGQGIGLQFSRDAGRTWVPRDRDLGGALVSSIVTDKKGQNLYCTVGGSVHRFNEEEKTWQPVSNGLTGQPICCLGMVTDTSSKIFAGGSDAVYLSTDAGISWKPIVRNLIALPAHFLATHPIVKSRLILAGAGGVLLSTNNGRTWKQTTSSTFPFDINALTFDPSNAGLHYASTPAHGVQLTTDGGNTWKPANSGIREKDILAVTLDPEEKMCYAWTASGKSYRSSDGGKEWKYHSTPWKLDSEVMIAFDRYNPAAVVSIANRADLYYSNNGGTTWFAVPVNRLHNRPICLWLNEATATLYAGTDVDGVYRLKLGAILPRLILGDPAL